LPDARRDACNPVPPQAGQSHPWVAGAGGTQRREEIESVRATHPPTLRLVAALKEDRHLFVVAIDTEDSNGVVLPWQQDTILLLYCHVTFPASSAAMQTLNTLLR